MSHKWSSVVSGALATLAAIMIASGLVIAYFQNVTYKQPLFRVLNPQAHYASMLDENTVSVTREFEVFKPLQITVTRELVQKTPTGYLRVELPGTIAFYPAGKYNLQRVYAVPGLKSGKYEMEARACWKANLLRQDCINMPTLPLEIQ